MKSAISVFILLFTLSVTATSSFAQGRGKGQGQGGGPKASAPKSTAGGKKAADTPRPKAADATHARSEPKAPKVAKEPRAAKELKTPKAHATKTAPVTTTTGPIDPITPTTPISRNVKNPRLESRLLAMLPAGTTIQDASQGFKNWGQFVAAVHVSNNLNIPFADLKARMTGLTPGTVPGTVIPTTPLSLGQAIQSFKGTTVTPAPGTVPLSPTTIATEVKKAEDAANAELRRTRERS